jgi:type I restriction enzyme S subunit
MVKLGDVLKFSREPIEINPLTIYKQITVKLHHKGVVLRGEKNGQEIKSKQYRAKAGQFIISRIDARNGAMGLIPPELDGAIVTNDFLLYDIDKTKLLPKYFDYLTSTNSFVEKCVIASEGTTNRVRLKPEKFLKIEIPLPPLEEQKRIVVRIESLMTRIEEARKLRAESVKEEEEVFNSEINKIFCALSKEYKNQKIRDVGQIVRGKGPIYFEGSGCKAINQKCVRWNTIDLNYAKEVDIEWVKNLHPKYLANEGDILVNSTGEGTIGRAAVVPKGWSRLPFDSHVLAIKLQNSEVIAEYIVYFIRSPQGQLKIEESKGAKTTKQTELGVKKLGNISIPLPPLPIQRRVVAYLDSLQAKVDELKKLQEVAEREMEELVPSILDKAFKGEL